MSSGNYDWYAQENLDAEVFPSVQAVAVYQNKKGDLVIRQQGTMGEDDSVIFVPLSQVPALLEAMKNASTPIL
jgi:hypothetical protein